MARPETVVVSQMAQRRLAVQTDYNSALHTYTVALTGGRVEAIEQARARCKDLLLKLVEAARQEGREQANAQWGEAIYRNLEAS